jgi:TonB family protein
MIFLTYLLKSSVCAAILWIVYYALFRKETHFVFNRFYLLSVIPLSSIIPLLQLPLLPAAEHAPLITIEGFSVAPLAETATQSFPTATLLLVIYFSGVGFVAFRFIKQLRHLHRMMATSRFSDTKNYSAFTFFRKIHINKSTLPAGDYEKILWHEQVHARQLHSVDLVVAQLFVMIQWFNPFAWRLKKSIVATHEYLADAQVLAHGVDVNIYQQLLFNQTAGAYPEYASGFSYSLIKKRLIMMTKNNTGKFFALKLCGLLPAIALPVALFGLSTAEIASPVISAATSIETPTQATDMTWEDAIAYAREYAQQKQKTDSITTMGTYSITIQKDTAKTKAVTYVFCEDTAKIKTVYTFITPAKNKEERVRLVEEEENVYLVGSVDVNPEFPGGQNAMMRFIYDNLRYPIEAMTQGIQGRVTVVFTIKSDGNVDNVKTHKSADPLLDAEAERVVKAMPAWTPGKHKGSTVAVRFILPIVFQMKQDKAAETK